MKGTIYIIDKGGKVNPAKWEGVGGGTCVYMRGGIAPIDMNFHKQYA